MNTPKYTVVDTIRAAATLLLLQCWMPASGLFLATQGPRSVQLLGWMLISLFVYIIVSRNKAAQGKLVPPYAPWTAPPGYKSWTRLGANFRILRDGTSILLDMARDLAREFDYKPFVVYLPMCSLLIVQSPDHIKHFMDTNFYSYEKGWYFHKVFADALGDGIFNSDGAKWKKSRRASSHLFSSWQLEHRMGEVFHRHAQQLVGMLREGCRRTGSQSVDMQQLMYRYTFDCIYEIAFGRVVDSLGGNPKDVEFQKAFDTVQCITVNRFLSIAWPLEKWLGVGKEREMKVALTVIKEYVRRVIEERKKEAREYDASDLIAILEKQVREEEGRDYTDDETIDFISNFTIAGRDTTASLMTWALYELSHHPSHTEKLVREFATVEAPSDMHYTQAVLQEVLRLHPSVPFDGKFCVQRDVFPDGTAVEPGTLVMFNPAIFNVNPHNFEDPLAFKPERWMNSDGSCRMYDLKGFAYPAFNAGPRTCLGRHMAMQEAKIVLSHVLSEFAVCVPGDFVPKIKFTIVLMTENGMPAVVTPRAS
ncbi:Cytochrome P450 704C1 [Diplonema papillatum]|nr:Cytochrome P450 704C1 [Diplonema papillatum]